MSDSQRRFLPDRLRPRVRRRRPKRRYVLPSLLLTTGLLVLPLWTVRSVEVRGAEAVPAAVMTSLESLVGHAVPTLDLEWLRAVAETWPAAAEVRVRLELSGTAVVEVFPEPIRGSVALGRSWHAVAADGGLAGSVDEPRTPVLAGFGRAPERRQAFTVARRLADISGGEVVEVRKVTPVDYRVELRLDQDGAASVVHVTPEGTAAERAWCERAADGATTVEWADLRWPHRMVLRSREVPEVG
jgi:hypothetical protein